MGEASLGVAMNARLGVAGLAVADKGRRVYIVGGHFGLVYMGHPFPDLECYLQESHNLSAEIFELDLGDEPITSPSFTSLQDYVSQGTSHWRQVLLLPERQIQQFQQFSIASLSHQSA